MAKLQILSSVTGLAVIAAFLGKGQTIAVILATGLNALGVVAGVLLWRQAVFGLPGSVLFWGLQAIQFVTAAFTLSALPGPALLIRWFGSSLGVAAGVYGEFIIGPQAQLGSHTEITVNVVAVAALWYLLRNRAAWRARAAHVRPSPEPAA